MVTLQESKAPTGTDDNCLCGCAAGTPPRLVLGGANCHKAPRWEHPPQTVGVGSPGCEGQLCHRWGRASLTQPCHLKGRARSVLSTDTAVLCWGTPHTLVGVLAVAPLPTGT